MLYLFRTFDLNSKLSKNNPYQTPSFSYLVLSLSNLRFKSLHFRFILFALQLLQKLSNMKPFISTLVLPSNSLASRQKLFTCQVILRTNYILPFFDFLLEKILPHFFKKGLVPVPTFSAKPFAYNLLFDNFQSFTNLTTNMFTDRNFVLFLHFVPRRVISVSFVELFFSSINFSRFWFFSL